MSRPTEPVSTDLSTELLEVLAKHGVRTLPTETTAVERPAAPSDAAIGSYITSIITGSSAFDAAVLNDVTRTLQIGTQRAVGGIG
jgi:hypothetical protein